MRAIALAVLLLAGCVAPNPDYVPAWAQALLQDASVPPQPDLVRVPDLTELPDLSPLPLGSVCVMDGGVACAGDAVCASYHTPVLPQFVRCLYVDGHACTSGDDCIARSCINLTCGR